MTTAQNTSTTFPPIWIAPIADISLKEKCLALVEFQKDLNEYILLKDFGTGIENIKFIPILLPKSNKVHTEQITYNKDRSELLIKTKLDFDVVKTLAQEELNQVLFNNFYTSLKKWPQKVKNFDMPAFQSILKIFFKKKGWVIPKEE